MQTLINLPVMHYSLLLSTLFRVNAAAFAGLSNHKLISMKKAVWIIVGIFVVVGVLLFFFNNFFDSNILVIFSILYLAQFLLALVFISVLDKSKSQIYLPVYFIAGIIAYIILFIKLF